MSNKPRKSGKQRKKTPPRRNTPLSGHKQSGKTLQTPFNSIAEMKGVPWLRDRFPSYLWVCYLLSDDIARGTNVAMAAIDVAVATLDRALGNTAENRAILDGSLLGWERVPEDVRSEVLADLEVAGIYKDAFPESFAHVLGMYPGCPGSWLLTPWLEGGLSVDPVVAEQTLSATIVASIDGQGTVPTRAKALAFRGVLTANRIHFGSDVESVHLLKNFPNGLDEDELAQAEAFIRATFGVLSVMEEQEQEKYGGGSAISWAERFWQANWRLYSCTVFESAARTATPEDIRDALQRFTTQVNDLWSRFEEAAVRADPDLFNPERYEVLTGMTARCLRLVSAAIHTPAYWTTEHSAPLTRSVVETLITLTWLSKRSDPALFEKFIAYGRGHVKLWKLHLEEYADSLDEVPEQITDQIDYLDRLVNDDIGEEFQDIDISGNFAGTDIRKMAYDVNLQSVYRLSLAPSSADFHGEWGHLSRYALTRCANPTHRFHRIPRQEIEPELSPPIVEAAIGIATRIVDTYIDAVKPLPTTPGPNTEANVDPDGDGAESQPTAS